ncbi:MAG TPA: GMC family oxidoreductase [Roseiarcus sp.]|nr:GMC family oxidoreductase [Roseiarcus sp.]
MNSASEVDVVVIGSGMGGASFAAGLAPSGARIVILERGERLLDSPETRDPRAIFQRGFFRPKETWYDGVGEPFNPGNYYYVGGNTKLYGAVLIRYRAEDFRPIRYAEGATPGWPFAYEELEPWYGRAEALYQARGRLGDDPSEPSHSTPYPFPPVPDESAIAAVRERLKRVGLHPFSLPLGVDIARWLDRAKTPWDAFPDTDSGKMDAETCGLKAALAHDNVTLLTGARAARLETDAAGKKIVGVLYEKNGETLRLRPRAVALAAGAVNSALILLASANGATPNGLANRSDQVGRNFMNHNSSAALAIDPFMTNDSIYQKTIGLNDFYLSDGRGGPPLGNVQLLGKVSGPILKSQLRQMPERALAALARRAVDFYFMSEDLPSPESRVRLDGTRVVLDWRPSNMAAQNGLIARMREMLKAAGFPIVLVKPFDRRTPSHQCGTIRMGADPARAAVDPECRAFDHPNLYIVDASVLPTSAAVNPALTVAALALRAAEHMRKELFA